MDYLENFIETSSLHRAVIDDDVERLRDIIEQLGDTQIYDQLGYTPLELAYMLGRDDCVELLETNILGPFKVLHEGEKVLHKYSKDELLLAMGVVYSPTLGFRSVESIVEVMEECPEEIKENVWEKRDPTNITVVWVNEDIGYGVITNRHLQVGDFIGEYTGDVRRVSRLYPQINAYCVEYPTRSRWLGRKRFIIDAQHCGTLLRYVNHSNDPNLEGKWVYDRGLLHLLFYAKKEVPRGFELTIDYGTAFWQHRKRPI